MDEKKNERARRGIESIAHLFLSQLNEQQNNGQQPQGRPVRNAPGSHQDRQEEPRPDIYGQDFLAQDNNEDLDNSLAGEIVIAYHLRDSYAKVCDYARQQAQHDQKIMLVSIDQYELSIQAVFGGGEIEQAEVIAETEGPARDLIPLINQIAEGYDTIILNIDPSFASRINEIISCADCVTIISDTTADGIVRAYQTLKSVVDDIEEDQEIQLFVCDAADNEQADRAFYKFSETARKFINRVVIPAGASLVAADDQIRPLDDSGLTENEVLALNMVDAGLKIESEPEAEVAGDSFIYQSDTESVVENVETKTETSLTGDRVQCNLGNSYKPACSDSQTAACARDFLNFNMSGQYAADQQEINQPYSDLVIARPGIKKTTGPTRLIPLPVTGPLAEDSQISAMISLNFATLTGGDCKLILEHRAFTELFDNARLTADTQGRVTVILSCIYSEKTIDEQVAQLADWLNDNLGVLATRFRHLHLKINSPIELAIIVGDHAGLNDQKTQVTSQLTINSRIWQMTTFTLVDKEYISLH